MFPSKGLSMRTPAFLSCALSLLALASPALLRAQFQEPTQDELKMTADPKAPGADAVYLYREETTDDSLHFHSYYERIKILTEKGKELATISTPYERGPFKVTDIKGRTIHADGSIVLLTAKPTDLMDEKTKGLQVNTMVFTLPSAEVGSILEYRLQLRYDDNLYVKPSWQIQQPYFVHKAHYMFNPPHLGAWESISDTSGHNLDRLMYSAVALPLASVVAETVGRYTVDLSDIPPTPREDWMPPLNTINERIEFYYTYARSAKDYWDSEGKHWAKETERFTNPGREVKDTVDQIVSTSDSEEQKARKIYAAVMKIDNTDFSRAKSDAERKAEKLKPIKNAEDVWKQKAGSGDEMALLFVALARAAGLKVWPMQVVDRSRAIFDPSYLFAGQLDDYIAVIDLGGKETFLDPGQKMCPFGLMHWKHYLASGFRLAEKGAVLASTPANTYAAAVFKRVANVVLSPDGAVKGQAAIVMTGPDALHWRQIALENDPEELKRRFRDLLQGELPEGIQAEFDHFSGVDDPSVNFVGFANISGNLGTATGKRTFLPAMFFESRGKHPFVAQDKRTTPVDVHFARAEQDEVTYRLPPGFSVESAPQTADLTWPDHAMLRVVTTTQNGSVLIKRVLAHNYTILDPREYADLHGFYQKVAAADQQQLVLTTSPPAKGN
jgi:hypothetical protein